MLSIRQAVIAVVVSVVSFVSLAAQHHDHKSAASKPPEVNPLKAPLKRPGAVTFGSVQLPLTDVVVLDQDGRKKRFYSDLIKDKIVVLSFFFTRCVNICPAMNVALQKLQANLGEALGKEVFIVTVSRDPEYDTPERLKEWSKASRTKAGWTLVTGELPVLKKLVLDFTGDGLGPATHSAVFMLGNDRTGEWLELNEFSSPEDLREQIDLLSKPKD